MSSNVATAPQFHLLSASALASLIQEGKVTSKQVVQHFLERSKKLQNKLNAIVEYNPNAIQEAEAADEFMKKNGKPIGRLHGVPVTIKEHIGVKGMHATFGSELFKQFVSPQDATVVSRLRAEGAIVLGTTNMPELGLSYETDNAVYGRTNNPYNVEFGVGGSSGGEGAALAARCSPLGIGSDIGGSIRIPAALCGVVGLKPTAGAVPLTGMEPIKFTQEGIAGRMLTFGPMANSVDDLELAFDIIRGFDGIDPMSIPKYPIANSAAVNVSKLKVAYFVHGEVDKDVKRAVDAAVVALKKEGVEVHEQVPKGIEEGLDIWCKLAAIGGDDLASMCQKPTPQMKYFLEEVAAKHKLASPAAVSHLVMAWDSFRVGFLEMFKSYDAVLCPVTAKAGYKHGDSNEIRTVLHTLVTSAAGVPAIAIGGVVHAEEEHVKGLPVGVQLFANLYREDICLALARVLEKQKNIQPATTIEP